MRVGLVMQGWLIKNMHFKELEALTMLPNDTPKLNDANKCFLT